MNEWMNNPAMQSMDPMKMELIRTAAAQTHGKKRKSPRSRHDGADHQRKQERDPVYPG